MESQTSGPEHRLTELEVQIDRLNLELRQWQQAQEHLPIEERLAQLTEQCADILKQWSATGDRHALAVSQLESRLTGWNDVEARLQRDAASRFQSLERIVENEWASLRSLHEEPTRQLRAHADSLAALSVATAGSAQTGLERAEARLATLERDLHRRMDELSQEVRAVARELRQPGDGAARGLTTPWSFDEVTRLHHGLRGQDAEQGALGIAMPERDAVEVVDREPARRMLLTATKESNQDLGDDPSTGTPAFDSTEPAAARSWVWSAAVVGLVVALLSTGAFAVLLNRQAESATARSDEAIQRAEALATAADQRIATAQEEAAARLKQASETASKAQVTTEVLTAPDLLRFNLVGGDASGRYSGQLLWSRSRGMVFSASRLPAPSPGSTYQVWLLTGDAPVSAGTFVPDAAGRVTAATGNLPSVPRPVIGASVTLEPEPGGEAPSGTIVLTRAQ